MTPDEAWTFIRDIESGAVTLTREGEQYDIGNVTFKASNGWTIIVFSDSGEWDYIDSILDDQGGSLDFDDMPDEMSDYQPSDEVIETAYGWGSDEEDEA